MLAVGILLAGPPAPAAATPALAAPSPTPEDALFDRHELVTGRAPDQTVVAGFFLGGAVADLAVVHVDDRQGRRLRLYAFDDGGWRPRLDTALGPEVAFVDVATIGGRDRLITCAGGRLSWFDPGTATEKPLLRVAAPFQTTDAGAIPRLDVTRDLNGDGRDDLILPAVEGFWISTQAGDGTFADAVRLGPAEPFADRSVGHLDVGEPPAAKARTWGEVGVTAQTLPVYLGRVHPIDYDRDGRTDLVFWNEDHFEVHLQDDRGRFDPVGRSFPTAVSFDSDGVYTRAFDYSDEGVFSLLLGLGERTERTVLHSLGDLDGDGVADLVTLTLSGRSLTRQRSRYAVHSGRATPGGTEFTPDPSAVIHPRGRAGGMQPWGYASQRFEDFDGDGRVDVLFRGVHVGATGMVRALVGNSVPINLEYYRMEDGAYSARPTVRRKIRRFAPFAGLGNVFFPAVLTGDVDGDGHPDLVVSQSPEQLHVFLGVPGPALVERRPRKVAVATPHDERNTWLLDLNRDGKQDVLMHRAPTEHAPDEPHRVTVLIAR